jgi:hypothetical protein
MPSLSEAYTDKRASHDGRDPRRVALGAGVSLLGAVAMIAGLLLVTTPLAAVLGLTEPTAAKHLAGILAGLGGPAVLIGIVAVLPSARRQVVGVAAGVCIAFAGVALFSYAYPAHWTLASDPLVFETAIVYFLGGFVACFFVFIALANVKRRNDPHGTVTLAVEKDGETEHFEVTPAQLQEYKSMMSDGGNDEDVITEIRDNRLR